MSSESFYSQDLPPLTRSTTTHGRHHSSPHIYYSTPNKIRPDWTAKGLPSFVNLLTTTKDEHDWFGLTGSNPAYPSPPPPPPPPPPPKQSYRRTFHSTSPVKKDALAVRKSRSMRDSSKKLHSPPPPIPSEQPPQLPEKRFMMPFVNKIKRKLSLSSTNYTNERPKPRRSVSSSALNPNRPKQSPPPLPQSTVSSANGLADYQGYSSQKKHRSFTYSPPPPPRSSSLAATSVPAVPPLPPAPKLRQLSTRSSSLAPVRKSSLTLNRKLSTAEYAKNISHDLALIEKDIRALEIQRDRHSSSLLKQQAQKPKEGRKRGKTLPGSLATPPPPSLKLNLPPMTLNPIELTIPANLQLKKPTPRQSTSTTPSIHKNRMKLSDLTDQALFKPNSSEPLLHTKKPYSNQSSISLDEGTRSPKSVKTSLKYFGQYLSEYERQVEIHQFTDIYFVGPHAQTKHSSCTSELNHGFDDEHGNYKIVLQDHLAYRYEILDLLGRGSFGQVVKCYDHKTGNRVAIKLIRNKKRFHAQGMTEINILKKLIEWDPEDQSHTIRMTDYFQFRNHLCIAFECLTMNLYEFIKANHFRGFSLSLIKKMIIQILQSLSMLAKHDVIHCDLKPENIMLIHPAKSAIKVIDFGSSCLETERVYTYIQSRFYRSPEVILGLPYNKSIDMWSVGCIVAELYTGMPLFPGENEQEQLSCILEVMGLPDKHLIERCSRRHLFFDVFGQPRIVPNSKGKKRMPGSRSLQQVLKCNDEVFIGFIQQCLCWDPTKRLTPQKALQHEWIVDRHHATSVYSRLARKASLR